MHQKVKTVSAESSNPWRTIVNLWPYMWPAERLDLKMRVVWASLFLVIAKLVLMLVPYYFKWATDALNGKMDATGLLPAFMLSAVMLVIAYNLARIVQMGINQFRDALFASVGQYAVRRLAHITFLHMHQLSLRFHLERKTGGLSRIIERGTKGIETIVRFTILNSIPTLIEFALTAVIFWWGYGFSYLAITAVTVAVYVWFTVKASDWRIAIRRAMNDSDTDANVKAIDSLLNFETVKYFGNEDMEARRFDASMARYEKAATQVWTSLGWLNFGQGLIFGVGMTVMLVFSALAVQRGEQTIGDFVFVNALLLQLSVPLNFIGMLYREIRQGLTDIEQMFDLLAVEPEVRDAPDAKPLAIAKGAITFENVHFAYDPARPILKGISFTVPEGKTVAVVGPSGAGKSTISRLLYRFYDVQQGAIRIDGQDVRDITQTSLRAAIGMVPQDTVLFNDTIAYNIRYGRPEASDAEMEAAADIAQISRSIRELPQGYKTMVGERGLKLSGGEKQRVAIARTVLKSPPILILDEATSALDTTTEQDIQAALDIVSQNRTTLVIAHRLSTVIGADEIIVLKAGEIAERGTHAELLAQNGLYASMWNRQREATQAEEHLRQVRESDDLGVVTRLPPAV
ncbi:MULTISPECIES: ABCB family ABC transporter ATP-binding protein/permease [Rhizobium/Agrobacterium group]|uniref:ABC transporter nucleotide binding/ATPase protein n=2 Tax=Rhizobium/Agrobacterium group TaxID=227290 RepID=B9JUQ6_ALLAM|nr:MULTISPECIES: ABC transporter ATP-binding protein/permease [Rhizobium/Agrobacterium group]ACM36051.1 ABC transporter nucleotide binding/ATPase protein [Allorhizobium ampelinum S4]MCF1449921.1 ABC transporter ATP-binding protein/permease [Allorhizobium ampelinum]MCF1459945.1 ABC transporter ATP-binding protein/permease [Allorhizobium ampelinum]MCF1492174.1 ABC transporter ATP-binding protein/permease [Allorhizobium ampelinum]MUO29689.1 ATP-binding cassette domain-containing protein [Agrobact